MKITFPAAEFPQTPVASQSSAEAQQPGAAAESPTTSPISPYERLIRAIVSTVSGGEKLSAAELKQTLLKACLPLLAKEFELQLAASLLTEADLASPEQLSLKLLELSQPSAALKLPESGLLEAKLKSVFFSPSVDDALLKMLDEILEPPLEGKEAGAHSKPAADIPEPIRALKILLNALPQSGGSGQIAGGKWTDESLFKALCSQAEMTDRITARVQETLLKLTGETIQDTIARTIDHALEKMQEAPAHPLPSLMKGLKELLRDESRPLQPGDTLERLKAIKQKLEELPEYESSIPPSGEEPGPSIQPGQSTAPPSSLPQTTQQKAFNAVYSQVTLLIRFMTANSEALSSSASNAVYQDGRATSNLPSPTAQAVFKEILKDPAAREIIRLLKELPDKLPQAQLNQAEREFLKFIYAAAAEADEEDPAKGTGPKEKITREAALRAYVRLKETFAEFHPDHRSNPASLNSGDSPGQRIFENMLVTRDVFQQLTPLLQAAGEPGFLIFPALFQGFLSQLQLTAGANKLFDNNSESKKADTRGYERLEFMFPFPSLGTVKVSLATKGKEALIGFALEREKSALFLKEHLPLLQKKLDLAGFAISSLNVSAAQDVEVAPQWVGTICSLKGIFA